MNDRTLCQMEVHPELIRLRRERTELFKKWQQIYGPNPFQNVYGQPLYGQAGMPQSLLGALMGNIGQGAAGGQP